MEKKKVLEVLFQKEKARWEEKRVGHADIRGKGIKKEGGSETRVEQEGKKREDRCCHSRRKAPSKGGRKKEKQSIVKSWEGVGHRTKGSVRVRSAGQKRGAVRRYRSRMGPLRLRPPLGQEDSRVTSEGEKKPVSAREGEDRYSFAKRGGGSLLFP